jgi:hypothetical protein
MAAASVLIVSKMTTFILCIIYQCDRVGFKMDALTEKEENRTQWRGGLLGYLGTQWRGALPGALAGY